MQNDNRRFGAKKNDIVLDTDTYNEMDDQFAVLWALLSPERLNVRALTAAPFLNEQSASPADGMEKSFLELERIVELSGRPSQGLVWRGSAAYLPDRRTPVLSPAAFRIAELAREARRNGTRLKILAIAALTNVASALLLAPDIAESVDVVWLGGQPYDWKTQDEFNFRQDVAAVRAVFESGALFAHIPCIHGAETLITTLPELEERCFPHGRFGAYLRELAGRFMRRESSRIIWDISTVAFFCVPEAFLQQEVELPRLLDDGSWSRSESSGRGALLVRHIERDPVFNRFFEALERSSL